MTAKHSIEKRKFSKSLRSLRQASTDKELIVALSNQVEPGMTAVHSQELFQRLKKSDSVQIRWLRIPPNPCP